MTSGTAPLKTGILLFPRLTPLDAVGPLWATNGARSASDSNAATIALPVLSHPQD